MPPAEFAEVRGCARAHDFDRYLAALLAPRDVRDDLIALAATVGEIARVPATVKEPMMGEIRLTWWRDWLAKPLAEGLSGNPVADAMRRAIARHTKRAGRLWTRVYPDVPVTKKPAEVRMGSGKGGIEYWCARVKPGRIMFELGGVNEQIAKEALLLGAAKLPIKTRVVTRIG